MKKEYNIKDKVWIHMGETKLVPGRVVDIFDLSHIEGYSKDREFYVIEIQTGIDNIFEIREFDQISPDASGPIGIFRNLGTKGVTEATRYLNKVGVKIPVTSPNELYLAVKDIEVNESENEPTAEQIHAAMERAEQAKEQYFNPTLTPAPTGKPKKRYFTKRKKNGND